MNGLLKFEEQVTRRQAAGDVGKVKLGVVGFGHKSRSSSLSHRWFSIEENAFYFQGTENNNLLTTFVTIGSCWLPSIKAELHREPGTSCPDRFKFELNSRHNRRQTRHTSG